MKIILVVICCLLIPLNTQSQSVADSLFSIQQELTELHQEINRLYLNRRTLFYRYMAEHFPQGSGRFDMRMEFGGILRNMEEVIFDLKILRINESLSLDARIPDDLRLNEEAFLALTESWERKENNIESRKDYFLNHNYRSYTIPNNVMQMDFLPAVTNLTILLHQSAVTIRNAKNYIEENSSQLLTSN